MLDVPSKVRWSGKWQGTENFITTFHLPVISTKGKRNCRPLRHYQNYLPYIYGGSTCNWCLRKAVMSKINATFQGAVVFFFFLQAENGGLVMVSFYADFLTCTTFARMEDVMRK
jgi:hypothetical protein